LHQLRVEVQILNRITDLRNNVATTGIRVGFNIWGKTGHVNCNTAQIPATTKKYFLNQAGLFFLKRKTVAMVCVGRAHARLRFFAQA
jgi:ABC-type branched-subunit amino acid transport system ATPase component